MELWIRSQDKEKLLVVGELELDCYNANKKDYWTVNNYGSALGTYKTKERALEVLDDIQACKDALTMFESFSQKERKELAKELLNKKESFTYVMPQE